MHGKRAVSRILQLHVNRRRARVHRNFWGRFVQRKVFRIEQMMAKPRVTATKLHPPAPRIEPASPDLQKVERELASIYDAIEASRRELATLSGGDNQVHCMTRATEELGAAVGGMEKATHKILKAAEAIDESARALTASLKDDFKRGVAQDIQDQVVQIFETCNYQDISGQRISKAMDTLKFVEERVVRVLALWGGLDALRRHAAKPSGNDRLLNGPKLDGDAGHAGQNEIDRLFA
jgi:chemotaxis protein CheZ